MMLACWLMAHKEHRCCPSRFDLVRFSANHFYQQDFFGSVWRDQVSRVIMRYTDGETGEDVPLSTDREGYRATPSGGLTGE